MFFKKSSSTVSVLVCAPLYPPPLVTVAQPKPPLTENSHWNVIVDPSSLIPATGPKETVPPDPASTLPALGCCVIVTRTPVPVVVNVYDCALHVSYTHLTLPTKA